MKGQTMHEYEAQRATGSHDAAPRAEKPPPMMVVQVAIEVTDPLGLHLRSAERFAVTAKQYQAFYPHWHEFERYIDPAFDSAFWQRVTGRRPLDE